MKTIVLVIDSLGIGALPDADTYGDSGANTILHICEHHPGPKWPTLRHMGLGNAAELLGTPLPGCAAVKEPTADFAVLGQKSPGKDSTTGHWELADIVLERPFDVFPKGPPALPPELIAAVEEEGGVRFIGNYAASGTEIIDELGREHVETGNPICYTSADSVFQIAAHEEVLGLDRLYRLCEIARRHSDAFSIARVIARPFVGSPGRFQRTPARRDFSASPPQPNLMSRLRVAGCTCIGVGKIGDMFANRFFDKTYKDKSNEACLDRLVEILGEAKRDEKSFVFVNLVETDMIYGHRRDTEGYFSAVAKIDSRLSDVVNQLNRGDCLMVTADHGCDPTHPGTDHTREYVPLLVYRPDRTGVSLGIRDGHDEVASLVYDHFGLSRAGAARADVEDGR